MLGSIRKDVNTKTLLRPLIEELKDKKITVRYQGDEMPFYSMGINIVLTRKFKRVQ
ncbi:MAG: hypothetical protein RIN55_09380 [Tissierellaceae bacterium]|nr:hypothetical protein [Tissierellaceae bacterium]